MKTWIENTPFTNIMTLDKERQKLLSSTQKYKSALEDQAHDLKENTIKLGIQGLVFGAFALGSYLLIKAFQKKDKKVSHGGLLKSHNPGIGATVFASIQSYILSFVLAIARQKIQEYLEKQFLKSNESAPTNQQTTGF